MKKIDQTLLQSALSVDRNRYMDPPSHQEVELAVAVVNGVATPKQAAAAFKIAHGAVYSRCLAIIRNACMHGLISVRITDNKEVR